ncbi:gamma-glutamyltransferase family protein [Pseudooceanicola sediminis]|uniref:Gamma-glutamyltransferase family protein n=1 Tax=Pseudooceanicola sediminis TaxID=2211117 RepID=A0A399J1A7_9RHOB|nr:gamma-glutamyltransferase family protein [Pseudooceanicola sediminis]KAA2313391.1 gamma-glutamyltransferase family protein [Puniceibacterium sp. HSS470]RII38329.1 gamma-glutamyltransferase family protein [Pseudooceanicola sediminis]|tara:strand:- start:47749 stop:49323 length:1575 start_codon:yes stop_codon:yes gene_type:complete
MRDFQLPGRSPIWAENGICATSHPIAAQVAIDILKRGGNAMDAAIAGAVTLGVCEPAMCGLAGDCFVLVKPAGSDQVLGFNGSGAAPAGADAQGLRDQGHSRIPTDNAQAVTLPGAVQAFDAMSAKWGKLGLADSLAPAIHYFETGVPVHARVAFDWAQSFPTLDHTARAHFLPAGAPPKPGTRFALPAQAEVLRRMARDGARAFYEGEVADDMRAALHAAGGTHTAEDFATVQGMQTAPIKGEYKGATVFEHPPNGQGATAILILNILSHFDLAGLDPFGADRAHLEAEAAKLAYDARNRLIADPAHADGAQMLDPAFAAQLAARIDPARANDVTTAPEGQPHRDTVYITVVDKDRMAVSLIYSVFMPFGSGIGTSKFGLLMHNRGCGFTLTKGHPNELAPGKRPMHTIIPGMLAEDGVPNMPFGVMGGQYQAAGHARFVTNLRDFGLSAQEAIDAPRSFPDVGQLQVERGYDETVRADLVERGHTVVVPDGPIGGAQAIRIDPNGFLEAGSDPRKDGCAIGY